ncbi:hypothetical protein GSI_02782 [Ganoderma sinense ZZ0214-1]|uniref:Uncharacterized protein n=1 Tax=Ganoderma sinense ZZ0214-1 TaxID=1077348 RepID=A0A2G8SMK1_9APHY|nr:hypothetical protein GSI_02782 [Ganoderma sinense ZZ0214-1]
MGTKNYNRALYRTSETSGEQALACQNHEFQHTSSAKAITQYRLKAPDLRKIWSIAGHSISLYNEQSVEDLAWDRHGGPCGLWRWLKQLYDCHISEHGDAALFATQFSYQPGRKYDLTLPRPPPDPPEYVPYVGRSLRLQQIKASIPAWIWLVCHAAMDKAVPHDGQSESSWIMCLRKVLRGEPKLPLRCTGWLRVDNLEFFEVLGHGRGHGHYEWSQVYTERVLKALWNILGALRVRHAVRQHVVREIYDAYSGSLGCGIHYDPVTEAWSDPGMGGQVTSITLTALSPISPSNLRDDAPYGWITDIPPNVKTHLMAPPQIHKARAINMYMLGYNDLDGIAYEDRYIEDGGYYCNQYKERDIEWRPWQIHGGPIGYWQFYRGGARYDLTLAAPPELQDRYVCESSILRDAKRDLAPWIWNACNAALDAVLLAGHVPLCAQDLTPEREAAMKCATSTFGASRQLYADRPNQPLGPSPSILTLRNVLSEAPIIPHEPGSLKWGTPVEGLDLNGTDKLQHYDWGTGYLERVFSAACGVLEELGPDAGGWASTRWEVYDKYSQSLDLGIRYDRDEKTWSDAAAVWLDCGSVSSKMLQPEHHLRSKCEAGHAFNKLLPRLPSSS